MAKLTGKAVTIRAKELSSIRYRVIGEFRENPDLSPTEVAKRYNLSDSTITNWKRKTRSKEPIVEQQEPIKDKIIDLLRKGYTRSQLIKDQGYAERTVDGAIKARKKLLRELPSTQPLSFEEILKAVPDIQSLGLLVLEGFNAVLANKDATIDAFRNELKIVTEERDKLMSEFNERLAKAKLSHLTVDTLLHKIVKKE